MMSSALRYEWRRISSIRSTWILVGCAVLISAAFALLFSLALSAASSQPNTDGIQGLKTSLGSSVGTATTNLIVLIVLGTLAAQAFGQEYRHGTIRLTLTEFPKRTNVFIAKIVVCCAVILAGFLVSSIVAWAILQGNSAVINDGFATFGAQFLRTCLYLIGFCLIVFSLTVLTRILALGVIIPLVIAAVAEPLLASLVENYISWFPNALPFTSGEQFVSGTDIFRNGIVFGLWVLALTVAGYIVFERRDA